MRLRLAVLLAICAGPAAAAWAEPSFPYKAYISTNEVYVRSGPGEHYYPTAKLPAGAEVEVYRHDSGGWCAIRPPAGSFSWVGGPYLKPGADGLAEVTTDRVAARVGSQFSDIRDEMQVRLDRGEVVEVLGTKQVGTGDTAVTWYKIAPPAGEFRWVDARHLSTVRPRAEPRQPAAEPARLPDAAKAAASVPAAASPAPPPNWTPTTRPAASQADSQVSPAAATAATTSAAVPAPAAGTPSLPPAALPPPLAPEEFQAELDDINTELSIMLAEEPTVWNCDELSRRAQALLERAETAVQRGHARVLVSRLAQADDVKRRHDAANLLRLETDRTNRQLADLGRAQLASVPPRSGAEGYDGVGRLTRVMPAKLGAPRYALVDDQGKVQTYVSPAPGVNMQYYLGRRVGVSGVQGYLAEQNAPLLTAKHVTALDARVR